MLQNLKLTRSSFVVDLNEFNQPFNQKLPCKHEVIPRTLFCIQQINFNMNDANLNVCPLSHELNSICGILVQHLIRHVLCLRFVKIDRVVWRHRAAHVILTVWKKKTGLPICENCLKLLLVVTNQSGPTQFGQWNDLTVSSTENRMKLHGHSGGRTASITIFVSLISFSALHSSSCVCGSSRRYRD